MEIQEAFFRGESHRQAQAGGVVVASIPGTPTHASIIAYDKGATMYGMAAPSRRVTWFCNGFVGMDQMTTQGWNMFDAAILWASGTNKSISLVK